MCLRGEVGMNYQDWDTKDNAGSSGGFFSNMFFVGAAAGLIAGLLFAPQTGKKTREIFKERVSSFRDASKRRGSMNEGWTGGTNDGGTEKSLEGTVRADYLH
jgi:gas vesicle protein